MSLGLPSKGVAAYVLLTSSGVSSLVRLLVRPTWLKQLVCFVIFYLCRSILCRWLRFLQITLQHLVVDLHCNLRKSTNTTKTASPTNFGSSGNPVASWASPCACTAFCAWHSSSSVGPGSTASISPGVPPRLASTLEEQTLHNSWMTLRDNRRERPTLQQSDCN